MEDLSSQLIISKRGVILDNNLNKYLKLENGIIIKILTKIIYNLLPLKIRISI